MDSTSKKYDLTNENDCEELRNLLPQEENDEENQRIDIENENSDTDASVCVEEREENSESEQSDSSASSSDEEDDAAYFIGVQKKKKFSEYIRMRLPGVTGEAKQANGVYGTWNVLIDETMLQKIAECTNKYIESIQVQFSRPRDAKITDIVEIKAVIGLLYLAGVYHASRLSLEELWSEDGREWKPNEGRG
ncbi:hypothetical protein NQ314_000002 [Rhamnusium bicolor]|uniref:PiggyBac transposable element-derived protein domain-containing protein n=1 Tax=Rhamnusium bicolor TaxID=1586634 RepID=A0AAV8ZYG6_9CUCU|nr:hypothetical protein NQ314_000002 [Rhamnusium bicolor]